MKGNKLLLLFSLLIALYGFGVQQDRVRIFMIGDSTMANKPIVGGNPERGWGQMLSSSMDDGVQVMNFAMNGRSTRSFRNSGLWESVHKQLRKGDYLVIQFGHNDPKRDTSRYSSPEQYYDNLKAYVEQARAKGVKPILATPIVRRDFDEQGKLRPTHGLYPDMVRKLAKEMDVPMLELNNKSRQLIEAMGVEPSKKAFMWVETGTCAALPNGRKDNTHLSPMGARMIARAAVDQLEQLVPELAKHIVRHDFVVAKDGSGDFFTVQQAIDAVPDYCKAGTTTIYVKDGEYREKIIVPASKQRLSIKGQSAAATVIVFDNYASRIGSTGAELGTSGSATMYIYGDDFSMSNITLSNDAGPVGQAVALFVAADRVQLLNCRLLGNQDTLYTFAPGASQYYKNCYIEGTTDFIFGSSAALFEGCTLHCKRDSYITAASTPEGQQMGYIFVDCRLTAAPDVTQLYLGRPWRPFAKTLFIDCDLGAFVRPQGWHNWNKPDAERTTLYGEHGNRGAGASTKGRVAWSHILTKAQAKAALDAAWRGEESNK